MGFRADRLRRSIKTSRSAVLRFQSGPGWAGNGFWACGQTWYLAALAADGVFGSGAGWGQSSTGRQGSQGSGGGGSRMSR